jgi:hypothetical protein
VRWYRCSTVRKVLRSEEVGAVGGVKPDIGTEGDSRIVCGVRHALTTPGLREK